MTTNKPMTAEQLDELMAVAVRMQRDNEADRNFPSANFAYAVQVAVLELRGTRAVASALSAENAALKKYICDECYVENTRTGHYACAGHGMPSTSAIDAFLAEVRTQARNALIDELEARLTELSQTSPTPELRSGAAGAAAFVSTFRQEATQ